MHLANPQARDEIVVTDTVGYAHHRAPVLRVQHGAVRSYTEGMPGPAAEMLEAGTHKYLDVR